MMDDYKSIHAYCDEAYNLFHKGIVALARAERQGVRIDMDFLKRKKQQISNKVEYLEEEFKDSEFFKNWQKTTNKKININSDKQLGDYLYNGLKLPINKTTKGGKGSTDIEALKQLGIPELDMLLRIGKLKKAKVTYLEGFEKEQVNGYIHPFFNLHIARSFRSSIDSPNLQNVPIRDKEVMGMIRGSIFPRPGHQFLEVDFKGIEVAINACINKDSNLIKYVSDPSTDMHRDMAIQLFKLDEFDSSKHKLLRQAAKNGFVFPQFYGDWYKSCVENMACSWGGLSPFTKWKRGQGIDIGDGLKLSDHLISKGFKEIGSISKDSGKNVVSGFMKHIKTVEDDFWGVRFREYAEWKEAWFKKYQKVGYFDLPTGFRCSGIMDKKQVCNYPAQGSAFHGLLWAFIEADKLMLDENWGTKLVLQIHDSILLDVNPNELSHVINSLYNITCKKLLTKWKWIIVPLMVDMELSGIDQPWSKKGPFDFKSLLKS